MDITKIGNAKIVDEVIDDLKARADTTEELVVLRVYRQKDGQRAIEWWTTKIDSRVWVIGALNYLAYKMQNDSEGWDEDDE
jgi:hypothetical protein